MHGLVHTALWPPAAAASAVASAYYDLSSATEAAIQQLQQIRAFFFLQCDFFSYTISFLPWVVGV